MLKTLSQTLIFMFPSKSRQHCRADNNNDDDNYTLYEAYIDRYDFIVCDVRSVQKD
jgi:hypothetical protein